MVRDHQPNFEQSASADLCRPDGPFHRAGGISERCRASGRIAKTLRSSLTVAGFLALTVTLIGCQSGLVDPGRSRVSTGNSNVVSPGASGPQIAVPNGTVIPPAAPPATTSHPDWNHVARQPASSVVHVSPADDGKSRYHTVQVGETWSSLARQYGLTVKQLADANGIDPSAILKQGQQVYIPNGKAQ